MLTQRLLDPFTHRTFYTQTLLHTDSSQRRLHTETFAHICFYTDTFTRTRLSLHGDFLHTDAFTHRRFHTKTLLHTLDKNGSL